MGELDPLLINFLKLDGTSTTTDSIPFAEGIEIPTDKTIDFGGDVGDVNYLGYNSILSTVILGSTNGFVIAGGNGSSALGFDYAGAPAVLDIKPVGTVNLGTGSFKFNGGHITDLTIYNDLFVTDYIKHLGDLNTFIYFAPDKIDLEAGGLKFLTLTEGTRDQLIVNQDRANIDFRIHSDDEYDVFYADGNSSYAGFGHGFYRKTVTVDEDFELTAAHSMVMAGHHDNAITLILPKIGAPDGQIITISSIDRSTVTIDGNGAEEINGSLTQVLSNQYESITIVGYKNGSEWYIIADTR